MGSSKDLKLEFIEETINEMFSVGYRAPEVIDENPEPSEPSWIKVDMWALGVILYQLVSSFEHPFIKSPS